MALDTALLKGKHSDAAIGIMDNLVNEMPDYGLSEDSLSYYLDDLTLGRNVFRSIKYLLRDIRCVNVGIHDLVNEHAKAEYKPELPQEVIAAAEEYHLLLSSFKDSFRKKYTADEDFKSKMDTYLEAYSTLKHLVLFGID